MKLQIVSGPGEFPTGTSIKFTPESSDDASDIAIRDGQASIAFRSYYGGTTVIKAMADNLQSDSITITTQGTPVWEEGVTKSVADRPYRRYSAADTVKAETYVRYLSTDASNGNVAELQFYGSNNITNVVHQAMPVLQIVKTRYYSVDGFEMNQPYKGITIKQSISANGDFKCQKLFKSKDR